MIVTTSNDETMAAFDVPRGMSGAGARVLGRAGAVLVTAFTLATAGAAPAVAASLLYVDRSNPACSDTGSGTVDQPYCTIGAAAAKVAAGQTVQVAAGTYPESVTVATSGTSSAPITFTAAPSAAVTLDGQPNGFVLSGRSWVTINGFTITGTSDHGISVSNSSWITISNDHVSYAGQPVSGKTKSGVYFSNVTDSVVSGNTIDHNTSYGMNFVSGSTRNRVERNTSFNNAMQYQRAASGIRFYSAPGNTVTANVCHDNEDSGIEFDTGANNSVVTENVTYGNGDHGIDNYKSTGQQLVGNTVYDNVTAGINVEGSSTGATIANNIAVDNGIASPRTHGDIRVESGSTTGTTMDYDLVYLTKADTLLIWSSVSYTSLASFQSATGQEAHGLQADPRWVSPSGANFHLSPGSPAIDAANSGVAAEQSSDADGNPRVDDPATPNTGAGPRPYDDRGAYEYQPQAGGDAAPTPVLTVSPASGTVPLTVTADASGSTDGDATPISTYRFDFGDGSAAVGPQSAATAGHTYAAAGTYTVTVTVTDTAGLSSSTTATVQAAAPAGDAAPTAALTVSPSTGLVPLAVTADASSSTDGDSTPIATYTFDFGDGSAAVGPQTGATATHTYTAAGTYTVTVTVTDTAGLSSRATAAVTATADAAPTAVLSVSPVNGKAPLTVTADASASTDTDPTPIASYTFDFGDGSPLVAQATPTAAHTYTSTGTFTVSVTVTDTAGLSSTATKRVKAR